MKKSIWTLLMFLSISIFNSCETEDVTIGTRLNVKVYEDYNNETPVSGAEVLVYFSWHDVGASSKVIMTKNTNSSGEVTFTGLDDYVDNFLVLEIKKDGNVETAQTPKIVKDDVVTEIVGGF